MNKNLARDYQIIFSLLTTVIVVLFLGVTVRGEEGIAQMFTLKEKKRELIKEHHSLLKTNLALRQQLNRIRNNSGIDHIAKAHLGLAHPDEVIFVVPTNESTMAGTADNKYDSLQQ